LSSLVNPSTTRPSPPGCEGVLWTITMEAHTPLPQRTGSLFGVVGDYDASRVRSVGDIDKIPSPTGEPTDHMFGALDLDGDAAPDVLMGVTQCTDSTQHCLVIWDRQNRKFVATSMIPLEVCAQ